MTKEKIEQIVLDIIAEIAPDEDLSGVKPEIRLRDQLDLDSMDFLDIVMKLRKQHGIDVPEKKARKPRERKSEVIEHQECEIEICSDDENYLSE